MALTIHRTRQARADALSNATYIARQSSLTNGTEFLAALEQDYSSLAEMPALSPEKIFGNMRCHAWPVSGFRKYLIFYSYTESTLEIIRVMYGGRDLQTIFTDLKE